MFKPSDAKHYVSVALNIDEMNITDTEARANYKEINKCSM